MVKRQFNHKKGCPVFWAALLSYTLKTAKLSVNETGNFCTLSSKTTITICHFVENTIVSFPIFRCSISYPFITFQLTIEKNGTNVQEHGAACLTRITDNQTVIKAKRPPWILMFRGGCGRNGPSCRIRFAIFDGNLPIIYVVALSADLVVNKSCLPGIRLQVFRMACNFRHIK